CGPAGAKAQGLVSDVHDSVGGSSGDVVQRPGLHPLSSTAPLLVHQKQYAFALQTPVIFAGLNSGVKVTAGHEVFSADQARLDESRAEEEPAVRPLRNRRVS